MMRNPEQTIGKLIEKSNTAYISFVDNEGFPIKRRCHAYKST